MLTTFNYTQLAKEYNFVRYCIFNRYINSKFKVNDLVKQIVTLHNVESIPPRPGHVFHDLSDIAEQ